MVLIKIEEEEEEEEEEKKGWWKTWKSRKFRYR
jgi:hypothetical protein